MLILTRKVDDRICIVHVESGEKIELMVTSIKGGQVKLGFSGRKGFDICREEAEKVYQCR